ncbi:MAG: nucleoside triphosphate pyrophosphohydrolase [Deltaproteobacteria bacterium]|nr:nucleoside triphosphate pyrophosphohydrolase [Deltaproteobacteria bacterium]
MENNNFGKIIEVIDTLTGPGGCPWDKEQTPRSMCDYLIEECFELVEAIRQDDPAEVAEELGDVLFLLLFIARHFDRQLPGFLDSALTGNVAKMIRRHPHVYGEQAASVAEVVKNWEQIKKQEKAEKDKDPGVFASLPASLPPLLRAYRINSKSARVGFTWPTDQDQEQKLDEEWRELQAALDSGDPAAMEEEFGDYLFTLVEYGRRRGIKANSALAVANAKFLSRFEKVEKLARERGLELDRLSLAEMDALWDEIKTASLK